MLLLHDVQHPAANIDGSTPIPSCMRAGSMGRTAEDLIMLDSIVRTKNYSSTGEGMLPTAVNCSVTVNSNLSLSGLRIGLPSNYGEHPAVEPPAPAFSVMKHLD